MLSPALKTRPFALLFTSAVALGCSDAGGEGQVGSGGASAGPNSGATTGGAPSSGGASGGTTNSGGSSSGGVTAAGGMLFAGGTGGISAAGGASGGGIGTGGDATGGETGAGGATGGSIGTGGGSANDCPDVPALMGGSVYCSNGRGDAGSGYGYELWAEGSGTGCMTVHGVEATFSAEWSGVEDFLGRVGLDFNQTQTHDQIGEFTAEFAETKEEQDGGFTYVGIYGWTVNPLREFYILEDWGSVKPAGFSSDGTPRDEVGTLEVDGETYDVWKKTRENKPSIVGNATFDQYFSIRRSARQCGTVSVSEHFRAWEDMGLALGNFYEVKWLLESQNNSGSIVFTTATVTVD